MNPWNDAITELGEHLGMSELVLSPGGRFAVQLPSGRRIAAEITGDDLLLYASDPAPYDGTQRLLRAWRRTYLPRVDRRPIQTALREQEGLVSLVAAVRIPPHERSPYTLRNAIDHVSAWLDDIRVP